MVRGKWFLGVGVHVGLGKVGNSAVKRALPERGGIRRACVEQSGVPRKNLPLARLNAYGQRVHSEIALTIDVGPRKKIENTRRWGHVDVERDPELGVRAGPVTVDPHSGGRDRTRAEDIRPLEVQAVAAEGAVEAAENNAAKLNNP